MSSSVFIVGGSSVRDLYTRFVSGVFFPLHDRLIGLLTTRVRRGLEETQWWPRERLDALRLVRLRGLLGHAYRYVPYYKDVLDRAGLVGGAVTSLDDLQRLPLLTKSLIRTHSERLTSTQARQLARFNTGGSSGEPLVFLLGKERVSHAVAAKWRATRWWWYGAHPSSWARRIACAECVMRYSGPRCSRPSTCRRIGWTNMWISCVLYGRA